MSGRQSGDLMNSLISGHNDLSIEDLTNEEARRLLEQRRLEERLLEMEVLLVEKEVRRVRGTSLSATTTASGISGSSRTFQEPLLALPTVSPSRRGSTSSLLTAPDAGSRSSSPVLASREGALSPKPISSPRRSITPRSRTPSGRRSRSSSLVDRNARLPRAMIQALAEREEQEAQRQMEAVCLQGEARQKELRMRIEALSAQTREMDSATEEVKAMTKKNKKEPGSVTTDNLQRWLKERWLASTERELQRLRLELGSLRIKSKRAEHQPSRADLQLIEIQNQQRVEQLCGLQRECRQAYLEKCKRQERRERVSQALEEQCSEVRELREKVAERRAQLEEKSVMLRHLQAQNERLIKNIAEIDEQNYGHAGSPKMVTDYVCLKSRERELQHQLTVWERRKMLLSAQVSTARRRHRARPLPEPLPAPHCTPTGSAGERRASSLLEPLSGASGASGASERCSASLLSESQASTATPPSSTNSPISSSRNDAD